MLKFSDIPSDFLSQKTPDSPAGRYANAGRYADAIDRHCQHGHAYLDAIRLAQMDMLDVYEAKQRENQPPPPPKLIEVIVSDLGEQWDSIKACADEFKLDRSTIWAAVLRRTRTRKAGWRRFRRVAVPCESEVRP